MYKEKRVIRANDEVVRYYCDNGYGLSVAAMSILTEDQKDFMRLLF